MTKLSEVPKPRLSSRFLVGLWIALIFAIPVIIGMARHSFWLDETITAFPLDAGHRNVVDLAANLSKAPGSIAYTPLHTLLTAAWTSVSPPSEFWLRAINLPLLMICAWLAWNWARFCEPANTTRRWSLMVLFATSPFLIYYAYDFRPYLLLIMTGAMMAAGLLFLEESLRKAMWLTCGGVTLAFLTQPTVVLIVPWLALIIIWTRRKSLPELLRVGVWPAAVCIVPAAVVGWHYLQLFKSGSMASYGAPPTLKNLAFVLYEFLGFLGIGPTREALRALAPPPGREATVLTDLRPTNADWLGSMVAALILLIVLCFTARKLWETRGLSDKRTAGLWRAAIFGVGGLVVLMVFFRLKEYRFLARHVSFLFVPVCWPLFSFIVQFAGSRIKKWIPVGLVLALHLWSSFNLLFVPAYGRDDLRGAFNAAIAKHESGEASAIFFFGGWQPALFYSQQKEIGHITGKRILVGTRTGTGRHVTVEANNVRELFERGISFWCLGDQDTRLQQELLDLYAGKTVVVVTLRGTEADNTGLIKHLMNISTIKPASLGRFPFLEAFLANLPGYKVNQP